MLVSPGAQTPSTGGSLLGQRVHVLVRGGAIPGVVAARFQKRKRGEDRKPLDYDDLFLDVGAKDGDELRGLVRPGDVLVWHGAPLALRGDRFASRSFDNRIGCYVALEAARRIGEQGGAPGDVIAVAAVQEEVGDFAGSAKAFDLPPVIWEFENHRTHPTQSCNVVGVLAVNALAIVSRNANGFQIALYHLAPGDVHAA